MKKVIGLVFFFFCITCFASAQSGITWNMAMDIAPSSSGNEHPRIVTDGAGNPLVVWHHNSRAMFSRWNGTAFTAPVILHPGTMTVAGASWMGPDIVAHGDTVYAVFKQTPEANTSSHIYIVRSFNGGLSFSAPVRVDNIADSLSRFPTVTIDPLGNPIVGFMKFNASYGESRWVVTRSNDFGNTFSADVKASGWSSAASVICDCCPGAITCSGNTVVMIYRDNNSNIRDTWAGISTDGGNIFSGGINVDQNNWLLMACPASGPDGIIIGDTLYSVFMNGASGTSRTYFSKSSLSSSSVSVDLLTGSIAGLSVQNYPRIASDGSALAIVWTQTVVWTGQVVLLFTNNIANGFPAMYDSIDLNNAINADVAIANGNIFVVWEDDVAGTVKYRKGTFSTVTGIEENSSLNLISISPNPATDELRIKNSEFRIEEVEVYNVLGEKVFSSTVVPLSSRRGDERGEVINVSSLQNGIYFVKVKGEKEERVAKFVKQ